MHRTLLAVGLAALLLVGASPLIAGDFKSEAIDRFSGLEKKIISLAEAVPADKYTWRPQEGVRSISEAFLHITALNLAVPRMFGTPPPEGFSFRGFDKSTTDKSEIVAQLKESFTHFRKALDKVSATDADKMVKRRRGETTTRNALWGHMEHLSEHLGQSIAYARANQVTPPWSQER